jgi:hypothetical protein
MVNVVNFTLPPSGDATNTAIRKIIAEFTEEIYPILNDIQQGYIGATAPANPNTGQFWINTSVTPNMLNVYDDAAWIALIPIATNGGFLAAPTSPVQGDILYYNGTSWVVLPPGTIGQYLQTQGPSENPQWANPVDYIIAQSLGINGYTKWNSGKIEQWGQVSATSGTGGSVSFPIPFGTIYSCSSCFVVGGSSGSAAIYQPYSTITSGFSYQWRDWGGSGSNGGTVQYYAVGTE